MDEPPARALHRIGPFASAATVGSCRKTPGEHAGSLVRVGSENGHLVRRTQGGSLRVHRLGQLDRAGVEAAAREARRHRAAVRAAPLVRQSADPGGRVDHGAGGEPGHSPQMTLTTYAHVIDELRGALGFPLKRRSRGRGTLSLSVATGVCCESPRMSVIGTPVDHTSTIENNKRSRNPALRAGSSAVRAADS